jgi:hypothetical protein
MVILLVLSIIVRGLQYVYDGKMNINKFASMAQKLD